VDGLCYLEAERLVKEGEMVDVVVKAERGILTTC
jgi:hypothetical protein